MAKTDRRDLLKSAAGALAMLVLPWRKGEAGLIGSAVLGWICLPASRPGQKTTGSNAANVKAHLHADSLAYRRRKNSAQTPALRADQKNGPPRTFSLYNRPIRNYTKYP
jgi:hypothetical protein